MSTETFGPTVPSPASTPRVALVCMPFHSADRPSIQVGLMAAIAQEAGFSAETFHLNLDLAARVPEAYDGLCSHRGRLTGEWLFSIAAFGEQAMQEDEPYFEAFPQEVAWAEKGGKDAAFLSDLRHRVIPRYIDDCMANVDWGSYQVVGFTSTFQQNVASLALARRIKQAFPHVVIVFGGANMEDEMGPEYLRAFPFIDYAVVGEGDRIFPELLRAIAIGQSPAPRPGLAMHRDGRVCCEGQAPPVTDLNALPVPSYEEYFERAGSLGLLRDPQIGRVLPFESSRGCWWGAKHHCTFCGLNGNGMVFRAKSAERALAELAALARRHQVTAFGTTDNILDMHYIQDFFTRIAEERLDYEFFYEVKANLTPEQLAVLQRGGVRWLQPGIESLSTHVLQLMHKGTTMLQNVRLLKWCRYHRIRVSWNLIWGFAGETEEDYRRELELMRLLSHLQPPHASVRIWLERFSPHFTDRVTFPIHDVRPEASYAFVYPSHVSLEKVAYVFDYVMDDTTCPALHQETEDWIAEWQRRWESDTPDSLTYRRTLDTIFVDDTRGGDLERHTFRGAAADAYEYCSESIRTAAQVQQHLQCTGAGSTCDAAELLDEFCQRGLMVAEDGRYLSIAIPANANWYKPGIPQLQGAQR